MSNNPTSMRDLHASSEPLLKIVLAQTRLAGVRVALDVACGAGQKSGWLAEMLASGGRVVGVDWAKPVLHAAQALHAGGMFDWVAGDAVALPLRDQTVDLVWCSAAIGLFGDALAALRDMRRVLCAGGVLVVATGAYVWVRPRPWRTDLAEELANAYAQHIDAGGLPVSPADGLADGLVRQLLDAGFVEPVARAFLLPIYAPACPPVYDIARQPLVGEVLLANWPDLRTLLEERLPEHTVQHCDGMADIELEPELASVLLVVSAHG